MMKDFEKCREKLAELGQRQKDLDAKHAEGIPLQEMAEISAERAEIFVEFAKVYIELAALARAFAEIIQANTTPQATPVPSTNRHS